MFILVAGLLCAQPDFKSLRVRQLKAILKERDQACDGCPEKHEFVDRCVETWSLPVVVAKPAKRTPEAKSTTLRAWTRRAERNVILPCMRNSTDIFADSGAGCTTPLLGRVLAVPCRRGPCDVQLSQLRNQPLESQRWNLAQFFS